VRDASVGILHYKKSIINIAEIKTKMGGQITQSCVILSRTSHHVVVR